MIIVFSWGLRLVLSFLNPAALKASLPVLLYLCVSGFNMVILKVEDSILIGVCISVLLYLADAIVVCYSAPGCVSVAGFSSLQIYFSGERAVCVIVREYLFVGVSHWI